jgi:hypothetical protein
MSALSSTAFTHHHGALTDLAFGNGLGFLLWEQRRLRRVSRQQRPIDSASPFNSLCQRTHPAVSRAHEWPVVETAE